MTDNIKMSAKQIIELMKNMENVERNEFLGWLYNNYFTTRPTEDMTLATKYHIEDYLDRTLTEEELEIMKLAYNTGYGVGCDKGMKQALKMDK